LLFGYQAKDLKLSWQLSSLKSFQATSRVSCGQNPNVSETISASIIRGMMSSCHVIIPLMMEAVVVSETMSFCPQLTWLVA
jgi:hypothetical protein